MSQSVAVLGSNQVPLTYQVPVPGTLTALTAAATFDGTAAATFQPCLSFYDSDGNLLARATAPTVAAGASAEVSWFPRVASGEDGIRFDTDNEGGWLYVKTNNSGGPNSAGLQLEDASGGGVYMDDLAGGGAFIQSDNGGGIFLNDLAAGGIFLNGDSNGGIFLNDIGGGSIDLNSQNGGGVAVKETGGGGITLDSSVGTPNGFIRLAAPISGGAGPSTVTVSASGPTPGVRVWVDHTQSLYFIISGLPNADPGVSGAVWNNGGVLNISP